MGFEVGRIKKQSEIRMEQKRAIILTLALFLLSWQLLNIIGTTDWLANKFYLYTQQDLAWPKGQVAGATDWNPPYPRVAYQHPQSFSTHKTACEDIYGKFDLLGLGGYNPCIKIVKSIKPSIIIFGGFGNLIISSDEDNPYFEHLIYKAADPQLMVDVAVLQKLDLPVTKVTYFPTGDGKSAFIVGPDKLSAQEILNYPDLDRFSYDGVSGDKLINARWFDFNHASGNYIRIPMKASGGWTPNVSDLNPFPGGQQKTIEFYVDNKYKPASVKNALNNVDGVLYDFFRSRGTESDFAGADFNLDWVIDGQTQKAAAAWQSGFKKVFAYEKQVSGKNKIITNDGTGVPDGAPSWLDGNIIERCMEGIYSWRKYYTALRDWEKNNKIIICVDGKGKSWKKDSDNASFKENMSAMRYGLASAAMGNVFYGRAGGNSFYFGYVYDEYLTDLGYPTSEPQQISRWCIERQIGQWTKVKYCPYIRFFDKGAVIVNASFQNIEVTESDIKILIGYSGPYYRFFGGQRPEVNNGQKLTDSEPIKLEGDFNNGAKDDENTGDGILLFKKENYQVVADIIVGNFYNNDTSPGSLPVETTGSWNKRPKTNKDNPYFSQWNQDDTRESLEGIGYFLAKDNLPATTATFRPTIGLTGEYEVFEWHGWAGDRPGSEADNVKLEIKHAAGVENKTISQKTDYGQWNSLGKFNFNSGTEGYVKISADGANGKVAADAVKFVYTKSAEPPIIKRPGTITGDLKADFNCDNKVDLIDFGILLSYWDKKTADGISNYVNTQCTNNEVKDLDLKKDGVIDGSDFAMLFTCWTQAGETPSETCFVPEQNQNTQMLNQPQTQQ